MVQMLEYWKRKKEASFWQYHAEPPLPAALDAEAGHPN